MAYMSQENKAKLAPAIKAICKRYGVKATIGVRHHSTLVINIPSGAVDFIGDRVRDRWPDLLGMYGNGCPLMPGDAAAKAPTYLDVNQYGYREAFQGNALAFLSELIPAAMDGNHDNGDIQADYFDVGWYLDINVGDYSKPYIYTGAPALAA